jgi:hypothetical protein
MPHIASPRWSFITTRAQRMPRCDKLEYFALISHCFQMLSPLYFVIFKVTSLYMLCCVMLLEYRTRCVSWWAVCLFVTYLDCGILGYDTI